MNKEVFKLMKQRYGKVVLILCGLILLLFLYSSSNFTSDWLSDYKYSTSSEFEKEFKENQVINYESDNDEPAPYANLDEYITSCLSLFHNLQKNTDEKHYDKNSSYSWNMYRPSYYLPAFALLFIAFSVFFIDLKTNFNAFLFASGISRKKIFWAKTLFIGLPVLATYALGHFIQLAIIYARIPHEFINAPLQVLLSSIVSAIASGCLYYAMGSFIGVLVGNMFFGPLTAIVYTAMWYNLPGAIYGLDNAVGSWHHGLYYSNNTGRKLIERFFLSGINKESGMWQSWLAFGLLTALFLVLASRAYQKISLEENGSYLLVRSWRAPVFLFMSVLSSFVFCPGMYNPVTDYMMRKQTYPNTGIASYIFNTILFVAIIFVICWVIVYFPIIKRKISSWREKRITKIA